MTKRKDADFHEGRKQFKSVCETISDWVETSVQSMVLDNNEKQLFRHTIDGFKATLTDLDEVLESNLEPAQKHKILRLSHQLVVNIWMLGFFMPTLAPVARRDILTQRQKRASDMRESARVLSQQFDAIIDEVGRKAFSKLPTSKCSSRNIAKEIESEVKARTPEGASPLGTDAVRKRIDKLRVRWTP